MKNPRTGQGGGLGDERWQLLQDGWNDVQEHLNLGLKCNQRSDYDQACHQARYDETLGRKVRNPFDEGSQANLNPAQPTISLIQLGFYLIHAPIEVINLDLKLCQSGFHAATSIT
ncbi:MAG: hypothetical protein ACOH2H_16050 [Cypionkella sp.]